MLTRAEARPTLERADNARLMWRAAIFGSVVALVCLALCWSAFRTYHTLKQLQTEFLRNQAANISAAVEFAGRDLARISRSEFQRRIQEIAAEYDGVAEVGVIDAGRRLIAHSDLGKVGSSSDAPEVDELLSSHKIYDERFETRDGEPRYRILLPIHVETRDELVPGGAGNPPSGGPAFSIVAVSLALHSASFITRPGKWNLVLTASACGLLLAVTFYYFVALRHSLRIEAAQAREKQWVLLGRMSAALAHDMRNPLGAIKGLAQLLSEKPQLGSGSLGYVQTIVMEAERLEKLASDLLIFAKPKQPAPSSFPLSQIVTDIATLFERRLAATGVRFLVDDDTTRQRLRTDYDLLKRVLINLVENSLLAMAQGGALRLSGKPEPGLKRVVLRLEDEGEGLPKDSQRLFEPFFTTRASGTGLGLAISRQIVERLGGTIHLENRPIRGVICTLVLPESL